MTGHRTATGKCRTPWRRAESREWTCPECGTVWVCRYSTVHPDHGEASAIRRQQPSWYWYRLGSISLGES
jgi:PHP family Zn ribbon phosphoesterase